MKKILNKIFGYLPIIALIALIFMPENVSADIVTWALGIDDEDNCVTPGGDHTCFFCGIFEIIYNSGAKVANAAYDAFHTDLGQLVIIFLAVSIALITLKNVSAMGSQDPGALLNLLATRIFVCAAIYYILTRDYYNVLNLTITPILADGLGFVKSDGGETCANMGKIGGYSSTAGAMGGEAMPRSIGNLIICAIDDIEEKINTIFEYGRWALCRGTGPDRIFYVIPNPLPIVDGILLYIGGMLFMVGYPWIMADAVIQLGIALALFPFALAGFAFGGTKQYLPKLFGWILNTLFVFIFMGILIGCIVTYIQGVIQQAVEDSSNPTMLFLNPVTGLAFYGINMVKIIFVFSIGWMYMPSIRELAGEFAKGADVKAAEKVGDSVKKPINDALEKAADYGAEVAGKAAVGGARTVARGTRATARKTATFAASHLGTTDADGNKTLAIPGGRFFGNMKFTTVQNADGTTYLKREFTSITGRKHVMISDKYCTIKQEYDRSGKLIKNDVKFKHNFMKDHLIDKDGKFNVGAIQTVLNSNIMRDSESEAKDFGGHSLGNIAKVATDGKVFDTNGLSLGIDGGALGLTAGHIFDSELKDSGGHTIGKIDRIDSTDGKIYDASGRLLGIDGRFVTGGSAGKIYDASGREISSYQAVGSYNVAKFQEKQMVREAFMTQLAIEAMKRKKIKVGTYFSSRNVRYDPLNPGKIFIEQVDHDGKTTLMDLNINMTTGQYVVGYDQDIKRTHLLHKFERKQRIKAHERWLRGGGGHRRTWWGTEYESKVDSTTGELYYTRTRKKWLLFGPKVEKDFYTNRTVKRKKAKASDIKARQDNRIIIEDELSSITPDRDGRRKKKDLFYTYESYIDPTTGQMVYTAKLRKGWNIKNYYRTAKFATNFALRTPLALATTAINLPFTVVKQTGKAIYKPLKNFGSAGRRLFRASTYTTKAGAKNLGKDVGLGLVNTVAAPFRAVGLTFKEGGKDIWFGGNLSRTWKEWIDSNPWQTGNITEFTDSGVTVTDSNTGISISKKLDDETIEKDLDGTKIRTDNITGETDTKTTVAGKRTLKIFGTFGDIEINANLDGSGNVLDEKTVYHFSDIIQDGHDHFTYAFGGNQVVEDNGDIAADLLSIVGGSPNPKDLMFGFDEMFGKDNVGGTSMKDFILENVFVAGRKRKTNKMRTNISSVLV